MSRGEEKLAIQVGQKGYFGKVVVEVEFADREDNEVIVKFEGTLPLRWRSGALFGVHCVLEHVKQKLFPKGGYIRILCIDGKEVDTSNVVIAFVAAHALYKALDIQPVKPPVFDQEAGTFIFPK